MQKNAVQLTKVKGKYASKLDKTCPVFQKVASGNKISQAKVSYFTYNDPVNAYLKVVPENISFAVSKQDVYGSELSGAKMQLKNNSGKVVDEWISENKPHVVSSLPAGKYVLHEQAAPTGFLIATDIEITIENDGTVKQNGVEVTAKTDDGKPVCAMIDNAAKGEVQIQKTTVGTYIQLPKSRTILRGDNYEIHKTRGNRIYSTRTLEHKAYGQHIA